MVMPTQPERRGIRKVATALVSIVAAATTTNAHVLTTGRTGIVRKIMWRNRSGANANLTLGETVAAAWTPRLPDIFMVNGIDGELTEQEIPAFEFTSNIQVRSSVAAAAPADVQVMLEVEEIGD